MIEMGKKYRTRDGRAVRILATDFKDLYDGTRTVAIISLANGKERLVTLDFYGHCYEDSEFDLIPVPTKHEAWAVVINDRVFPGPCMVFNTKEGAEHHAKVCAGNLAYVAHVTWED